jgi:hypothetical protein
MPIGPKLCQRNRAIIISSTSELLEAEVFGIVLKEGYRDWSHIWLRIATEACSFTQ